MVNLKKNILVIAIMVLMILAIINPTNVYASSDGSVHVFTPGGSTQTTPQPTTVTPSPRPQTTVTSKTSPTPTTTQSSNLPKTGIGDYTGLIIVTIILGASTLFAYKKIKEYDKL